MECFGERGEGEGEGGGEVTYSRAGEQSRAAEQQSRVRKLDNGRRACPSLRSS